MDVVNRIDPRPQRKRHRTDLLVIHSMGDGERGITGSTPDDTYRFFMEDPEGVANGTLRGKWADRLKMFSGWWNWEGVPSSHFSRILVEGTRYRVPRAQHRYDVPAMIPPIYLDKTTIPYHAEISDDGTITQWQEWDTYTAHARGVNHMSMGAALRWDYTNPDASPSAAQLEALKGLITQMAIKHPRLEVKGHDAVRRTPKGCPGVDVASLVSWSLLRAQNMRDRARR